MCIRDSLARAHSTGRTRAGRTAPVCNGAGWTLAGCTHAGWNGADCTLAGRAARSPGASETAASVRAALAGAL
eukprot:12672547-Alexandrium_andersonii.AAC.1